MAASLLQLWFGADHGDAGGPDDATRARRRAPARETPAADRAPPDLAEFERLYRDRFEALCDYVYTFLRSRDAARDVVQDVFVRVWYRRDEVWGRGDPGPYLVVATRNAALNALRRRGVELRYEAAAAREDPEGAEPLVLDPSPGELDAELIDRVYEFIEALPPRAREVLTLRWRHGLSLEQIATVMEIGVASVRVTHARALAALRERLGVA